MCPTDILSKYSNEDRKEPTEKYDQVRYKKSSLSLI